MQQIKRFLEFDSIDDVPKDFSCYLCGDFCCNPKYIAVTKTIQNCKVSAFNQFHPQSSYFFKLVSFKCKLCFKKINAQKYFRHNLKCQIIYCNSLNYKDSFQIIPQINDNDVYKQKLQIDQSQQNQDLIENQQKQLNDQQSQQYNQQQQHLKCNKCSQTIKEKESYYHFKKCIFDKNYENLNISDDDMIKNVQFFTEFRKFCNMFQLIPDQYQGFITKRRYIFNSFIEQRSLNKKRRNLIKSLNKRLEYLKEY